MKDEGSKDYIDSTDYIEWLLNADGGPYPIPVGEYFITRTISFPLPPTDDPNRQ